jgi:hypothetical protein
MESSRGLPRHDRLFEGIAVVMLALASFAAAWCGYQSNLWNGEQVEAFERATQARVDTARAEALDGQYFGIDLALYTNYVNALAAGNEDLAEIYRNNFQPQFGAVFTEWSALPEDARPATPFDLPGYAASTWDVAAADASRLASDAFRAGLVADEHSDDYTLVSVVLAGVLFMAGIASWIDWPAARVVTLAIAGTLLLGSLGWLLRLPIA